jgi:hypothetical protein
MLHSSAIILSIIADRETMLASFRTHYNKIYGHFKNSFDRMDSLDNWNFRLQDLLNIYRDSITTQVDGELVSIYNFIASETMIIEFPSGPTYSVSLVKSLPELIEIWKLLCRPLYYSKLRPLFEIILITAL